MQQAAYAVPYTFEPIPLPDDMIIDPSMPYANYSPDTYDQDMIDRESSSLAAMWCMLDEEDELAQEEAGYPVWDVDSNEAVNQWSSMDSKSMCITMLTLSPSRGRTSARDLHSLLEHG